MVSRQGIDAFTALYCIIGNPVRHSLSPRIHNYGFLRFGINAVYLAFEVENLEKAIHGMLGLGIKGASVTIPFKRKVIPLLDDVDDASKRIGAVNTLINGGGYLWGANTDWMGVVRALEDFVEIGDMRFLVFGYGGSARAAIFGIMERGGHVVVTGRSKERCEEISKDLGCEWLPMDNLQGERFDGFLNCTPIGMRGYPSRIPFDSSVFNGMKVVMDLVYDPLDTVFLKEAEGLGVEHAVCGLRVLIYQAIEQFRLWTGEELPYGEVENMVLEGINRGE